MIRIGHVHHEILFTCLHDDACMVGFDVNISVWEPVVPEVVLRTCHVCHNYRLFFIFLFTMHLYICSG